VRIGLMIFATDLSIGPVELAREAEARGFESLFLPEHTHIPLTRRTPYPLGEPLPDEYRRTHDPFVALAAAAAVTDTIKLGTGICLVAQHDPIVLAKTVASLDVVSGGRFLFGIGYGWNADEMEDHGVPYRLRYAIGREKILAARALWTGEAGSFEGRHVRVGPSWSWPKPVQQPHPPVLVGGRAGPRIFGHVVEYGDGWMPIGGRGLRESLPELHRLAEAAGRDPASIDITVFAARADADVLEHHAAAGAHRAVLSLPPAGRDTVLPLLDRYASVLGRVG